MKPSGWPKRLWKKSCGARAEICGSTALFVKHPLERFYRDMHLHMMHGRHDIAAQIVGAVGIGRALRRQSNALERNGVDANLGVVE